MGGADSGSPTIEGTPAGAGSVRIGPASRPPAARGRGRLGHAGGSGPSLLVRRGGGHAPVGRGREGERSRRARGGELSRRPRPHRRPGRALEGGGAPQRTGPERAGGRGLGRELADPRRPGLLSREEERAALGGGAGRGARGG